MVKVRPLPPVELIRDKLTYNQFSGALTWRCGPKAGKRAGGRNCNGYRMVLVGGQQYFEHRIIWKMETGEDPEFIDHRDGKRDNNAWANLRSGSRSQNMRNMRLNMNNKAGVHGVREITGGIWRATITHAGRHFHLGCYFTRAEAVAARKAAEVCLGFAPEHGAADKPHYFGDPGSPPK